MSEPEEFILKVDVGPVRYEWCDRCQSSSLEVCDVTTFGSEGVSTLASFRQCERCDDEVQET